MTARPWLVWRVASVVTATWTSFWSIFDDRDGVSARLVQEPKVAITVDGGQKSVPFQAVPAHDAPLVVAECTQRA